MKLYTKQDTSHSPMAANPQTPFEEGDYITYINSRGQVENIIMLDHIEPYMDKFYDIYYKAMVTVHPRQFDVNDGRKWHVGASVRAALVEEVKLLCNTMYERRC